MVTENQMFHGTVAHEYSIAIIIIIIIIITTTATTTTTTTTTTNSYGAIRS